MFGAIGLWLRVVYEIGDFIVSAIANYAKTPEGAADFQDVQYALVEVGLLDPADLRDEQPVAQTASETVSEVIRAENNSDGARSAQRINRHPRQHESTGVVD